MTLSRINKSYTPLNSIFLTIYDFPIYYNRQISKDYKTITSCKEDVSFYRSDLSSYDMNNKLDNDLYYIMQLRIGNNFNFKLDEYGHSIATTIDYSKSDNTISNTKTGVV